MVEQKVKCVFCHAEINKSEAYCFNGGKRNQYFCSEEQHEKYEAKKKYKPPPKNSDGTINQRRLLTDYIQEQYLKQGWTKEAINWNTITAQIKNLMTEHTDWKYQSIKYVLYYMIEILGLNLFNENFNGSILNLVPFYFQEAKRFWEQKQEISKAIKEQEEDYFNDEVVYIQVSNSTKWNKNEIDIGEL